MRSMGSTVHIQFARPPEFLPNFLNFFSATDSATFAKSSDTGSIR